MTTQVPKDRFWQIFLTVVALSIVLPTIWIVGIFYARQSGGSLAMAAFDPSVDPFEHPLTTEGKMVGDFFYRESLPLGSADWSWNSYLDWRSTENIFDGSYSLKATYLAPWAGVSIHSGLVDTTPYGSLSLALYAETDPGDLYIEVYDEHEKSIGKQSLGWYFPNSKFVTNKWEYLNIPIANLIPETSNRKITGLSITSEKSGTIYFDNIRLDRNVIAHSPWKVQTFIENNSTWVDPFTTIPDVSLPYNLTQDFENGLKSWKTVFGNVKATATGIETGPKEGTTGSMLIFGGGKNWINYFVDTTVDWSLVSSFSIVSRFKDDKNFATCAFSNYGAMIQIYEVHDGRSTLMAQSPILPTKSFDWWKNINAGVKVKDNRITCTLGGESIISATLPTMPTSGTFGFETWDKYASPSPHTIREIHVTEI